MSSEDPLVSISEGATKGVLNWSADKIKELATKFKNRDVAFLADTDTMQVVVEQRKTSEYGLFKQYVFDPDLRILFQMGLTLRKLEKDSEKVNKLRNKIVKKYRRKGLHIAQFVQNGFFGKYVANLFDKGLDVNAVRTEILEILKNLDRKVVFVQQDDEEENKTQEILAKIWAHSPKTFIICSTKSAMEKCENISKTVIKRLNGSYDLDLYKTEIKAIYFLNKLD